MDSVLLESPAAARPPGFVNLIGSNYETLLKDSVYRFLSEIRKESCDFSGFHSIFFRLLQCREDPPLEIIWFYAAVSYHESVASRKEALARVLGVRDLLQLLTACSASCSGPKSIALLAPVISELYQISAEVEKSCEKFSAKDLKKLRKEIEHLVEGILSYIGICSGRSCDGGDASIGLLPCFVDLVRVWTARQTDCGKALAGFFPLVSDEIRDGFGREGHGIGYLAGVVMVEAFLLRLCPKLQVGGVLSPELQKEMKIWAVGSITGFRSRKFFEILLRLLLDRTLPITSLLSSKDEAFLRDILYDSVILVEYSFLHPGPEVEHSYDCMKSLAVSRLIVTHEAIQVSRANGDQGKAMSYINAFSRSCLPSALIKWVTNQIGTEKLSRTNATTPLVLLKWLLSLESQGLRVFEYDISRLRTKLLLDESKPPCNDQISKVNEATDGDLFFFDKGEMVRDDANDQELKMDTVFLSAAQTMKLTTSNGRKRKELKGGKGKMQVKYVKYKLHDSSVKDYLSPSQTDGMSSGSDVENPPSDEVMEEIEES